MQTGLQKFNIPGQIFVFLLYFASAIISYYIYYTFQTSPALIWIPIGVGIAAMIFGGYRMWIPIFLAQHFSLILYRPNVEVISFIIAVSYAIQAIAGLYLLRKFQFDPSATNLRNTLTLVAVVFVTTVIEPILLTLSQTYLGTLSVGTLLSIGRAWGGGIFSALIIVPFVTTWYSWLKSARPVEELKKRFELICAFALLFATNHFVFWTPYTRYAGISVIFFLPAVLIWFALRFHPRWLTLALLITAIVGIAGAIIAHPSQVPLNEQLLSIEIYIGLIAAIFLIFAAVVEERRSAYRRLEHAYETASAADKAKSEFIAILAHELRNPLAPLVSSLELLKSQPQSTEGSQIIDDAEKHAGMIRRLLDDLLDTARLAQRKFKLQKEHLRISSIIDQSVASVRDFARSRNHRIRVTISEDVMIYADPVRIKQVVINLLNNAVKYTNPGGTIELSSDRADDCVRIGVSDTGIGIAAETYDSLFEPFRQISSTPRVGTGLGIGLYITKRIVQMHDGHVEVESKGLGRGSTFTVFLPLANEVSEVETKRPAPMVAKPSRVLVVDDNEAAANALRKLLAHRKHDVHVAYTGAEALRAVETHRPDIVFLDIGLPDTNGYEVAKKLRASGWRGTLAALTGYGQEADRELSKEAGIDHHLVKPVGIEDLSAVIATS